MATKTRMQQFESTAHLDLNFNFLYMKIKNTMDVNLLVQPFGSSDDDSFAVLSGEEFIYPMIPFGCYSFEGFYIEPDGTPTTGTFKVNAVTI